MNFICPYLYRQYILLTPNKSFVFQATFKMEDINHLCGDRNIGIKTAKYI